MIQPHLLLLAAHALEKEGQIPFGAAALVVQAWKASPRVFGLSGYSDCFPDSNRALASIMGKGGLVKQGLLLRMAPKLYQLSALGKKTVRDLLQPDLPTLNLCVSDGALLLHLLDSQALHKYGQGQKDRLTWSDAVDFWGIRSGESKHRLEALPALLQDVERTLGETKMLCSGREVTPGDVRVLSHLHDYLQTVFAPHLEMTYARNGRKMGAV